MVTGVLMSTLARTLCTGFFPSVIIGLSKSVGLSNFSKERESPLENLGEPGWSVEGRSGGHRITQEDGGADVEQRRIAQEKERDQVDH